MFIIEKEFFKKFGHLSDVSGFAPGRVNLIGEHTDYTGGLVFPVALNKGTYALARKRNDCKWQFYSMNFKEDNIISLENDFSYKDEDKWANYPKGIISIMKDKGFTFQHGLDLLYYGDIPNGAGLSSSASIEMVTCTIVNEIFSLNLREKDFIEISKLAENNYMGVPCGIMDQFIIGMGKKNFGLLLNTDDLSFEHIPINFQNHEFLIIDSKVERKLSDSQYKKVTQDISRSISKLKEKKIKAINQLEVDDLKDLEGLLLEDELKKIKHIVTENDRTLKGSLAIKNSDVGTFGKYMIHSHMSLKNDLGVSLDPMDYLVEASLSLGALGARMTGAGFGGCLVVLIPKAIKVNFVEEIINKYFKKYKVKAKVYEVISDSGCRVLPSINRLYDGIKGFLWYGQQNNLISKEDLNYKRNQLLEYLKINDFQDNSETSFSIDDLCIILEIIVYEKLASREIDNTIHSKLAFITGLFGLITPLPSQVISKYNGIYIKSKESATDYFYDLCKKVAYIQEDKNMKWIHSTSFGDLKMTINMSKPEKDPRAIAEALKVRDIKYPKCLLCITNEGYSGRLDHPARQNLRLIPMTINKETWFFQYSPYAYYQEHGILIHENHKAMEISKETFSDMLDFVKQIPHYFIGSNADLPIVGGSILSHAHYQFGRKVLPIMKANEESKWLHHTYKSVQASIVKWPLSVIRLKSKNEEELLKLCGELLNLWRNYNDASVDIIAYSNEESHNTLTPICYYEKDYFVFDLILRNNRTSKDFPHGIFHFHEAIHGIKKENIGLIEAMGLAVLPSRLHKEIEIILKYLNENNACNADMQIINKHKTIIESLETHSLEEVQDKIGALFLKGLHHCGVFKVNPKGREAFKSFLKQLHWKERE